MGIKSPVWTCRRVVQPMPENHRSQKHSDQRAARGQRVERRQSLEVRRAILIVAKAKVAGFEDPAVLRARPAGGGSEVEQQIRHSGEFVGSQKEKGRACPRRHAGRRSLVREFGGASSFTAPKCAQRH